MADTRALLIGIKILLLVADILPCLGRSLSAQITALDSKQ